MRLATFLPLLTLAACEMIPGTQAALQAEARRKLTNELLDAPTARFQNVRAVIVQNSKATQLLCGEVNAKNALGAYAGFRRFMAERDTTFAVIDPNTGPDALAGNRPLQETFDRYWHEWGCDRT